MIEKYTFDLVAPRVRTKLILVKAETESRAHVVLKLMAYMLYYDPRLKVEVDVGMHYKPDLVVQDDDGRPLLWIDCGHVGIKKVETLMAKLKQTQLILVKRTRSEVRNFMRLLSRKVQDIVRLEAVGFESDFIDGIARSLQKKNEVTLYEVMDGIIGVAINDTIFETALIRNHDS